MNYASCDFESYWDDDASDPCSISVLGTDSYILHPKWECYQVAIVTTTGLEWVGYPKDAPWQDIAGPDWEWVAQNAGFDERVHYYLREWGVVPNVGPRLWNCTADLCAFSAAPRALAKAAAYLYGEKVSKDYRGKMKSVRFDTLAPDKQADVRAAGIIDAKWALRFWTDLSPQWCESERRISRLSRQQSWRGLRMDVPRIERGIEHLRIICQAAEQMIPFSPALSHPALVAHCMKEGIDAPPEINKNSDACAAWETQHGDKFKWVDGMQQLRSANGFLKKLETMRARILPSGRMGYQNKYFGSHTGRWSDGVEGNRSSENNKGFNSRNLPQREKFGAEWLLGKLKKDGTREPAEGKNFVHLFPDGKIDGVNLRYCIIPEDGHKFVIPDLRQIEPRCCFPGTLVLTDSGYKPISDVLLIDRVFDGRYLIPHNGILLKPGTARTSVGGARFTPDHQIFTADDHSVAASEVQEAHAIGFRQPGWADVWGVARACCVETGRAIKTLCAVFVSRMQHRALRWNVGFTAAQIVSLRSVREALDDPYETPRTTGEGAR